MRCPSCGDEFREGVTRCPDCGVELVSDEVVPRAPEVSRPEIPEDYSLLAANWEGSAGEFIEWLDDDGIPVLAVPTHDAGTVALYVPQPDLARAEQLLEEFHEEEEFEDVEIEFELDDLSERTRGLLRDGDLDTFGIVTEGGAEDMDALADRLEQEEIPVLVVEVDEDLFEIHVPERCREKANALGS